MSGLLKAALLVLGLLAVAGVMGLALGTPGQGDLGTSTGATVPAGAMIPAIDAAAPAETETATFAMG